MMQETTIAEVTSYPQDVIRPVGFGPVDSWALAAKVVRRCRDGVGRTIATIEEPYARKGYREQTGNTPWSETAFRELMRRVVCEQGYTYYQGTESIVIRWYLCSSDYDEDEL